jgi:hypothetical protein
MFLVDLEDQWNLLHPVDLVDPVVLEVQEDFQK